MDKGRLEKKIEDQKKRIAELENELQIASEGLTELSAVADAILASCAEGFGSYHSGGLSVMIPVPVMDKGRHIVTRKLGNRYLITLITE